MYPEPPEWSPDEAYWRALIDQGEGPPNGVAAPAQSGRPTAASESVPPDIRRLSKARDETAWDTLVEWQAAGRTIAAPVIGCNKGGLLVRVADGLGFVPASQLCDLPRSLGTPDLRDDLSAMVGRELKLRLIEIDRLRDRVICSERATMWNGSDVDLQLEGLRHRTGCEIEGVVRSLCDFGAFVDLGGVDGLIHISELSWQRVQHPSDVVAIDQRVRVRVLNVDFEGRRVGLSLKRLEPDPWHLVDERYTVGDIIDATITNVVHFGAFARVEEGIEGLIHISELSDTPFIEPQHIVGQGQRVRARILHIDPTARRLGLSVRQAAREP